MVVVVYKYTTHIKCIKLQLSPTVVRKAVSHIAEVEPDAPKYEARSHTDSCGKRSERRHAVVRHAVKDGGLLIFWIYFNNPINAEAFGTWSDN